MRVPNCSPSRTRPAASAPTVLARSWYLAGAAAASSRHDLASDKTARLRPTLTISCQCSAESPMVALKHSPVSHPGAPPDSSAISTNCWQPRRSRPLNRPVHSDSHRRGGRAQAKSDFRLQSINGSTIFSGPLLPPRPTGGRVCT